MLRKIILPLVLLIFTQQNFYGMRKEEDWYGMDEEEDIKDEEENELQQKNKWWEFLESDMGKFTCLSYHIRALCNNFFRKWCGVYKRVELSDGEFFYGTVTGIGWYPQFLNFHDHFRMGLFEFSYNLITPIYQIASIFLSKKKKFHTKCLLLLLTGFSFNIINFKIYNGLIKLNFINPFNAFLMFCGNDCTRGFNPKKWKNKTTLVEFYYFGKELKSISEIKELWRDPKEDKKKLIIKIFFYFLNIILPEIYIDINFFYSSDEKQQ